MKRVAVIGGGVAGMQTALRLAEQGIEPVIIEKEAELGGKLRGWHVLFPSFTPASEILTELRRRVAERGIEVLTQTEAAGFTREGVRLTDGRTIACDSVVLCSGFTLFDASIKEEYGYGIYDNVFTTVDIERMLNEGRVAKADGSRPKRIAFLHCVGSRDEKVCQQHCSKVCCITGVKQAMEMKQLFPDADVFNFYMDIRMFGPGYEEMYREAQQKYNIHFIRGRISEASPTIDGRVQIKAEDTLTGRPLRMSVDMLILIVGMRANDDNAVLAEGAEQLVDEPEIRQENGAAVFSLHIDAAGEDAATRVVTLHVRADEPQENIKERLLGATLAWQTDAGETQLGEAACVRVYQPMVFGLTKDEWMGILWAGLLLVVTVSCLFAAFNSENKREKYCE